MPTEPLPSAANAENLATALRRYGVLGDACVSDVVVENMRPTILSQIFRLRLTYDGAAPEAPRTVILKTRHPGRRDTAWNGGRHEVAFYTDIAPLMPTRLVPHCFDAHWDAAANSWHLLLEDLNESHVIATAWPLPPTQHQCETILGALARFHAAWWDDPRLGSSVGTRRSAADIERFVGDFAQAFARFVDRAGDCLSADRRALYERWPIVAPRVITRYQHQRNLTIAHGDAHVWNAFVPRDGGDDVRLFDWDGWRIAMASGDLAYMMAMHWYPDRRRLMERSLLDRYHATLLAHGVRDYDRQALDDDYRLSVLWNITQPVWQATQDIPPVIWWNNMERIFLAFDDLGCRDLLG
jgi:hypothetical protein